MTPDQHNFRARLIDLDRDWCRVATLVDIAETRAGRSIACTDIPPRDCQRIADEVRLALETIALTGRRI